MNGVKLFIISDRPGLSGRSPVLLFASLALVLTLLAGCMPVPPPATAAPAAAPPITLRFAVSDADQRPSAPYVNEFIDQVKALSSGSITIEPVWDAGSNTADGFERGVIQEVRKGTFPLGLAASRTWDTQGLPNFQALQAPFLITDDALAEAVAAGDIGARVLASLQVTDVVGLTMWPEDLRHPFSVMPDKPLLAPEDFKGLTIRSGPSNVTDMMLKTLGATPLFEDSGYQGAESGLRQGYTLNGKPTATANVTFYPKFQILFANGAAFAQLSEDQRTILRQAAAAVQKKAISEHPRDVDAGKAWCDDGGTIVLASDAQVAAFEQVEQPVFDMIAQDPVNAEVIAMIRDLKAHTTPAPGATACAPKAAAQSATVFAGLTTGLDNATQARIRGVNMTTGVPIVDVFVNGVPVINSGTLGQRLGQGAFGGWVYVNPGTYSVAFVPHGKDIEAALFAPVTVNAEAGHRYSVAAVGQAKKNTLKGAVVDETALELGIGAKLTDTVTIDFNYMEGADGVDELANGKLLAENIKYEESRAFLSNFDNAHYKSMVTGKPDGVLGEGDDWDAPATSMAVPWYGEFPNQFAGGASSQRTSELNVLDFLAGFNGHHMEVNGHVATFNTVLAAIEKAGMHDYFANGDPYFFLAPPDDVFAALPQDQRDALLADPQALATLLKAHLMEGYIPYGSLTGPVVGQANREITNMLGQKLKFFEESINGEEIEGPNFTVGNGNRVQLIYKLLPVK